LEDLSHQIYSCKKVIDKVGREVQKNKVKATIYMQIYKAASVN